MILGVPFFIVILSPSCCALDHVISKTIRLEGIYQIITNYLGLNVLHTKGHLRFNSNVRREAGVQ